MLQMNKSFEKKYWRQFSSLKLHLIIIFWQFSTYLFLSKVQKHSLGNRKILLMIALLLWSSQKGIHKKAGHHLLKKEKKTQNRCKYKGFNITIYWWQLAGLETSRFKLLKRCKSKSISGALLVEFQWTMNYHYHIINYQIRATQTKILSSDFPYLVVLPAINRQIQQNYACWHKN